MFSFKRLWRAASHRRGRSHSVSSSAEDGRLTFPEPEPLRFSKAVPGQATVAGVGDIPFEGWVGVSVILPARLRADTGLLLMIHGMGSDWDEHDETARRWTNLFNVVCLQVRDRHAGPRGLEIPIDLGKFQTVDCLRAVAWVLDRWPLDRRRIFVWGGSGGGHMALMSMILAPDLFAGGIACCPFTHPTLPGEITGEWQDGWIRRCIVRDSVPEDEIAIRSPLLLVHRLYRPLILMHGDDDGVVSVVHSRRLAAALAQHGMPARYHEIPGADHDFLHGPEGMSSRREATETLAAGLLHGRYHVEGQFPCGEHIAGGWFVGPDTNGLPMLTRGEVLYHDASRRRM